jgi:hypothetical protein|tara:strand:+ start:324 stop:818 length:495 start_codon:yes stop_codon:yes gene_type:complete
MRYSRREEHLEFIVRRKSERFDNKFLKKEMSELKSKIEKLDDETIREKIYEMLDNTKYEKTYHRQCFRDINTFDISVSNIVGLTKDDCEKKIVENYDGYDIVNFDWGMTDEEKTLYKFLKLIDNSSYNKIVKDSVGEVSRYGSNRFDEEKMERVEDYIKQELLK